MAKKNSSGRARINVNRNANDPDFAGKRAVSEKNRNKQNSKNKADTFGTKKQPEVSKKETQQDNSTNGSEANAQTNKKPDHSKHAALNIKPTSERNSDKSASAEKTETKKESRNKVSNDKDNKPTKTKVKSEQSSKNKKSFDKKAISKEGDDKNSRPVTVEVKRFDQENTKSTGDKKIATTNSSRNNKKIIETVKPKARNDAVEKIIPVTPSSNKTVKKSDRSEQLKDNTIKTKRRRKRKPSWRQHPMPVVLRVALSIFLLFVAAIGITWFILWRENYYDLDKLNLFIGRKPQLFAYSCAIVFCLMAPIAAVTWHIFFTIGLSFSIASIMGFVQMQKMQIRGQPFFPEEISLAGQAGELTTFVDGSSVVRLIWGVVFVMAGSILLEIFACKVFGKRRKGTPWWQRFNIIPRITYALLAFVLLLVCSLPVKDDSIDWTDGEMKLDVWNQAVTYVNNGFIIGFYYNAIGMSSDKPEEYSKENMLAIAEKYRAIRESDGKRVALNNVVDNIIVVLDESFYDPSILSKYVISGGDVTPVLHKIFQEYPSGYMYSPEYGGGTANVEFEVQTGLSNFFAQTMPYQTVVPKLDSLIGVASSAKNYGFSTTAIHSYDGIFYKRYLTYPVLGYDSFMDRNEMKYQEHDYSSGYINDWSIYNEALDVLRSDDKMPKVINLVTMQNHSPYFSAMYPYLQFSIKSLVPPAPNHDFSDNSIFAHDLQTIHESDKYLGEFLSELDKLEERTVVLWFGDHAASVLDEYINSEDPNDVNMAHLTPYFIYANFDIESEYTEAQVAKLNKALGFDFSQTKGVDLPITTPNCLLNQMYDILGVEKAPLYYLVDAVCEEMPILASAYLLDNELPESQVLEDYKLANYDVINGNHYWYGD